MMPMCNLANAVHAACFPITVPKAKFYIKEMYCEMMTAKQNELAPVHRDQVLYEIRKKEAWAREYITRARDASKKYILSAVARAEEIKRRVNAETEKEIQRLREEKEKRLQESARQIDAETKKRIDVLTQCARNRTEKVLDFLMKALEEELNA
jgi:vacuolar-type H+-ATPase subunit H